MISEILGAFILCLTYLTQTEKKYRLCNDDGIQVLIVASGYFTALALSCPPHGLLEGWSQSPLNPAIAIAIDTYATFDGDVKTM